MARAATLIKLAAPPTSMHCSGWGHPALTLRRQAAAATSPADATERKGMETRAFPTHGRPVQAARMATDCGTNGMPHNQTLRSTHFHLT